MKRIIEEALELLRAVERYDLEDLELEVRGMRFHLSRGTEVRGEPSTPLRTTAADPETHTLADPPALVPEDDSRMARITSPMVGMFYRSSAPDKPPFVEVGQIVEVDQPVCIIEAMKLMNVIKANARGRVARILVDNQTAVQPGQALFLLEQL